MLQRRGSREIVNEAAVVALLRARGFELASALIPEELPLLALLTTMRRASLVVTIHGAGMINQVFMPVGAAAVIEAFQPRMVYGTGFQLSSACGFYHQVMVRVWVRVRIRVTLTLTPNPNLSLSLSLALTPTWAKPCGSCVRPRMPRSVKKKVIHSGICTSAPSIVLKGRTWLGLGLG